MKRAEERKSITASIRMREKDVEWLERMSRREQQTFSNLVRTLISEALKARGITIL